MPRRRCDHCGGLHNSGTVCGPTRTCSQCQAELPATEEFFAPHLNGLAGLRADCRSCKNKQQKASRDLRPDAVAERQMLYYSGITMTQYQELLDQQGGVCAICKKPEPSGKRLSIDHDHACCPGERACGKCVRGLLCNSHNAGLGRFQDDEDYLSSAVRYLRRYKKAGNKELSR